MECNVNVLVKLSNDLKKIIHAEETGNSEKVMEFINMITSTSNTLKNLVVNKSLHSSYIQTELNDEKEMIINILSEYVVPLLKYINHPALLQELKLNIDAATYEKNIDANMSNFLIKKKLIVMIETCTGQPQ